MQQGILFIICKKTFQQVIVKAMYPHANLAVVTELLHRQFPNIPLSGDIIRWSCYTGSILIAEAICAEDPQAYTGSFNDGSGTPMVIAIQVDNHMSLSLICSPPSSVCATVPCCCILLPRRG